MRYYAIADLHGRYDLLLEALTQVDIHVLNNGNDQDYKIITLGDYIDRGPDSKKIIDYLMEGRSDIISLQGNHEAMMVESISSNLQVDWWVGNGGDTTAQSYGWGGEPYNIHMYSIFPADHTYWLKSLPIFYETEKQIFVHAGIPQHGMNLPPKNERHFEQMQWMLYAKNDSGGWKGKHVVHGHHQFADGPHQWLDAKRGGRTDLDTYAWKTGRLVIGVFDDTQLHALEFIEVKDGSP